MADKIVHKIDRFSSINIDVGEQILEQEQLIPSLKEAITTWRHADHRGVWVKVPKEQSAYIPGLIELGFDFHHAQPGYVLLTKWLPVSLTNNLPAYANHYVGVAGFVVNSHNQVLVIRERYLNDAKPSPWKLPGGLADKGEDLAQTAKREVQEETGVEAQFVALLAFRHMHQYRFGCSDIYFVCLMKPLSDDIQVCPNEIAECKWMDLDDYENLENIAEVNKFFVQQYRAVLHRGSIAIGAHDVRESYNTKENKVYSVSDTCLEQEPSIT